MLNLIVKVQNSRWMLMEFCRVNNINNDGIFEMGTEQEVYFYEWAFVQSRLYWQERPKCFHGVECTAEEFIDYFHRKSKGEFTIVTQSHEWMEQFDFLCREKFWRIPDNLLSVVYSHSSSPHAFLISKWRIQKHTQWEYWTNPYNTSRLFTISNYLREEKFKEEFLQKNFIPPKKPIMNHYHTAVVAYPDTDQELKKIVKSWKYEIIPYKVRIWSSEESVKMEMARELPEGIDIDDVKFKIQEIFE